MNLYFAGSGLEDINGVFEESNTYQPSVPSSDAEIIVRLRLVFQTRLGNSFHSYRSFKTLSEM